ncbi:U3 small nucleolar RNA-associated protein 7 [Grifola frondosa]|uniref:U three protein 7 n=1 Tax=Grifola frondosa TaxID=5627 RepID=A0A1C7MM41_GRIFR|nr:U3 small nucleolar RNA-associated protein 7 [Grifola frondosa]
MLGATTSWSLESGECHSELTWARATRSLPPRVQMIESTWPPILQNAGSKLGLRAAYIPASDLFPMDSLIAKADAIRPVAKRRRLDQEHTRRKSKGAPQASASTSADPTVTSVSLHTTVPRSLRPTSPVPENIPKYAHIPNKKLRTQLTRQAVNSARSKALLKDAELLLTEEAGRCRWKERWKRHGGWARPKFTTLLVRKLREAAKNGRWMAARIVQGIRGMAVSSCAGVTSPHVFILARSPGQAEVIQRIHLAVVGKTGHVATFDWQTGTLHAELQLRETCRDITFLHDHSHFAVAQNKYVFIYDRDGVELHRLKSHIEPTRLEFLPYHWLLASVGNAGYLKYQDTSTGQLLVEHRTKLGACTTMTQNVHNAVIHLGHQNGTVTLWTPNLPHPAVCLLAHLGPVVSVSVDPNTGGRYMATAGQDSTVKVWDCRNWKGAVRQWSTRGGNAELEWSQKGALAVATGGSVNVYTKPSIQTPFAATVSPPLYLTHPIPHRPLTSVRFCPFQDILTIGHCAGLSSILVPGSGEPNFDSSEADPFENKKARREREVKGLLDKIQPDMITLDPEFVGSLAPPSKLTTAVDGEHNIPFARLPRLERLRVSGKADETEADDGQGGSGDEADKNSKKHTKEEKEKKKMRGKNKSLKRYLRKQRKNVIDARALAVRARLEKQREERQKAKAVASGLEESQKASALDRFKRSS